MSDFRVLGHSMSIRFEKLSDGTFGRTGDLPDGTDMVWIYRDGHRSARPFARELAIRIVEKCIGGHHWFKCYELTPAPSQELSGERHLGPDQIEGLASLYEDILWPDAE
jgi:hypothetical protein